MLGSWKKKWLELVPDDFRMLLFDQKDGPSTHQLHLTSTGQLELDPTDPKVLTLEIPDGTWQFELETEDERTMWAIHFLLTILKAPAEKGAEPYLPFHLMETASFTLREVLAINDKQYQGDGVTFVKPSHLKDAEQSLTTVVDNLHVLEEKYGNTKHWTSILAPYINLIPRAGLTLGSLQTKLALHQKIDAYQSERTKCLKCLQQGQLTPARVHWAAATAVVEKVLADPMFKVSQRTGQRDAERKSGSQGELLGEAAAFKEEFHRHEEEVEMQIRHAQTRHNDWCRFTLFDRVTQAFASLDRTMAICHARSYPPPYHAAPPFTLSDLDHAETQCQIIRTRLDKFIRANMDQAPKSKDWSNEIGMAAAKWKLARDALPTLRLIAEDYALFHRFGTLAAKVPPLCLSVQPEAETVWKEAAEVGEAVKVRVDSAPTLSVAERASLPKLERRLRDERVVFSKYFLGVEAQAKLYLGKCKDSMESDGEDGGEGPQGAIANAEWWLNLSLQPNSVSLVLPATASSPCIVESMITFAVMCKCVFRRTLDELKVVYSSVRELQPFFTECENKYAEASNTLNHMSVRCVVHEHIMRFVDRCAEATFLLRQGRLGEDEGPDDAKQLDTSGPASIDAAELCVEARVAAEAVAFIQQQEEQHDHDGTSGLTRDFTLLSKVLTEHQSLLGQFLRPPSALPSPITKFHLRDSTHLHLTEPVPSPTNEGNSPPQSPTDMAALLGNTTSSVPSTSSVSSFLARRLSGSSPSVPRRKSDPEVVVTEVVPPVRRKSLLGSALSKVFSA